MVGLRSRYVIGLMPVTTPRMIATELPRLKPLKTRPLVAQRWSQICPLHSKRLISDTISLGEEVMVRSNHPRRDATSQPINATAGTTTPRALQRWRRRTGARSASRSILDSVTLTGLALGSSEDVAMLDPSVGGRDPIRKRGIEEFCHDFLHVRIRIDYSIRSQCVRRLHDDLALGRPKSRVFKIGSLPHFLCNCRAQLSLRLKDVARLIRMLQAT